jgi:glycosyltransferase involved in cell wall biosynthesis
LDLKSKAVVVPLGIDIPVFQALPYKEVFHSKFPATRGRAIVLFVSRLDPKKGVELLLPAFADARKDEPGAILVIAGSGAADYEAKLKMLATSLQLDGDVIWAGFLDGADKLSAYSAASLFVLPSYSENFGIALVEAMAAGVACISSDHVAAAADAGDAVEVVPCEKESLRAAMVRLLKDGAARASLGRRASATAQRLWSLETTGARLAKIYREVAH